MFSRVVRAGQQIPLSRHRLVSKHSALLYKGLDTLALKFVKSLASVEYVLLSMVSERHARAFGLRIITLVFLCLSLFMSRVNTS